MNKQLNKYLDMAELADYIADGIDIMEAETYHSTMVRPLMQINGIQVQLVLTNFPDNMVEVPEEHIIVEVVKTGVEH